MIATRPASPPASRSDVEQAATQVARLLLLAFAGVLMQLGWIMVWTLSYRLTHGNDFTYVYLVSQSAVWEKLHDLLVLANTLTPGLEGPQGPETLDIAEAQRLRNQGFQNVVPVVVVGLPRLPGKEADVRHLADLANRQDVAIDDRRHSVDGRG